MFLLLLLPCPGICLGTRLRLVPLRHLSPTSSLFFLVQAFASEYGLGWFRYGMARVENVVTFPQNGLFCQIAGQDHLYHGLEVYLGISKHIRILLAPPTWVGDVTIHGSGTITYFLGKNYSIIT